MSFSGDQHAGVLRLTGRLDVRATPDLRPVLHRAVDHGGGDLVLDMSGVEFVDATGLGLLVGVHRRAERRARRLVLRGIPPQCGRLLVVTRLHRILHVEWAVAA
ncbi:MAG: STAS domain-containing protein [Carbonactinosporaceae bacterium]